MATDGVCCAPNVRCGANKRPLPGVTVGIRITRADLPVPMTGQLRSILLLFDGLPAKLPTRDESRPISVSRLPRTTTLWLIDLFRLAATIRR